MPTKTYTSFKNKYGELVDYLVVTEIEYPDTWLDRYNAVAPSGYEMSSFETFGDKMYEILDEVSANNDVGVSFWRGMSEATFQSNLNSVISALS